MRSFWHLEKGDFFDGIEECKEHFLRSAQRIELKKNDIVFFEGDAAGASSSEGRRPCWRPWNLLRIALESCRAPA